MNGGKSVTEQMCALPTLLVNRYPNHIQHYLNARRQHSLAARRSDTTTRNYRPVSQEGVPSDTGPEQAEAKGQSGGAGKAYLNSFGKSRIAQLVRGDGACRPNLTWANDIVNDGKFVIEQICPLAKLLVNRHQNHIQYYINPRR